MLLLCCCCFVVRWFVEYRNENFERSVRCAASDREAEVQKLSCVGTNLRTALFDFKAPTRDHWCRSLLA